MPRGGICPRAPPRRGNGSGVERMEGVYFSKKYRVDSRALVKIVRNRISAYGQRRFPFLVLYHPHQLGVVQLVLPTAQQSIAVAWRSFIACARPQLILDLGVQLPTPKFA